MSPAAEAARGFSKRQRLLDGRSYQRVLRGGVRTTSGPWRATARCNGLPYGRLGLAISRRQVARAVDRNRLKRLVRESFRHHQQRLAGIDVVVSAGRDAAARDNRALAADLQQLWQRVTAKVGPCAPSSSH